MHTLKTNLLSVFFLDKCIFGGSRRKSVTLRCTISFGTVQMFCDNYPGIQGIPLYHCKCSLKVRKMFCCMESLHSIGYV